MNVGILGVKRKYKEIVIMVSEGGRYQRFRSGCFSHYLYLKFRKQRLILDKIN